MLFLMDLDGTLVDSQKGLFASFQAGLGAIGVVSVSETSMWSFLGATLPVVVRSVRPDASEAEIDVAKKAFRQHFDLVGIRNFSVYPGVRQMLEAVKRGRHSICIVTSKPEPQARRVLKLSSLDRWVDDVVGVGPEERESKTELIRIALKKRRMVPGSALMLGDRKFDIEGAVDNGVLAVGALWGYGSQKELADAGCAIFVTKVEEFRSRFCAKGQAGVGQAMAEWAGTCLRQPEPMRVF